VTDRTRFAVWILPDWNDRDFLFLFLFWRLAFFSKIWRKFKIIIFSLPIIKNYKNEKGCKDLI
jgi:hypothetical protein